jgi:SPP1 gp7 family putative phage head morphogenesis protein
VLSAAFDTPKILLPQVEFAAIDAFETDRATASIRAAWSSAANQQVLRWERSGHGVVELPGYLLRTSQILGAAVDRHAAWQAVEAYAREHEETWRAVAETPETEEGLPHGWQESVYRVWSAILDRRTCPVCHDLDGEMVPMGKRFTGKQEPPVHGNCRCIVVTMTVPEELRKRLPGIEIDYSEMKTDVADYFRGAKLSDLRGVRHAESYIREALEKTSPVALTRRLQNRSAFRATRRR